ncbi:MAG: helix-hairpin-helix domain-containing protein [Patescibacteria group bacterium]
MKAIRADAVKKFTDIPNVGSAMAKDFEQLGIKNPKELKGKNALTLYKKMCVITKSRQDPCVLDTYMAVIDFMNGAKPKPWWHYTAERKHKYPNI